MKPLSRHARALFASLALLGACWSSAPAFAGAASTNADVANAGLSDGAALTLLRSLNAELLAHDSATATLQHWCADHRLAAAPRITATLLATVPAPATAEQRALLRVGADEPVRYRHVQLRCGAVALAEAGNWYVPARLTAAMNRELDATDTPFGAVVRALNFRRRTLEARLLWSPPQPLPEAVLEHRALLVLPDGTPFSLVDETYLRSALAPAAVP